MNSVNIIITMCLGIWGAVWAGFIEPEIGLAGTAAFFVMDLLGMFNRDKLKITAMQRLKLKTPTAEELDADAAIHTTDAEGVRSSIYLRKDGTVEVKGNPPPELIEAATLLKDSIRRFGAIAVAEELQRQFKEKGLLK